VVPNATRQASPSKLHGHEFRISRVLLMQRLIATVRREAHRPSKPTEVPSPCRRSDLVVQGVAPNDSDGLAHGHLTYERITRAS